MPTSATPHKNIFEDDDDEGWQDMPVIREDNFANGLDEEDRKKFHYVTPSNETKRTAANATGNLIDFDEIGQEWREKAEQNESEYTRLRGIEEDDSDEVHLRTKYLFDEDKAMTPLGQMQTTKNLLTEAQRIAYVGLCALTVREMSDSLMATGRKELKAAKTNLDLWGLKIMGRLYYHMELATEEQKMIDSLAAHGVQAMDLAPYLMTTHTVANPEYDPEEARRLEQERLAKEAEKEEQPTQHTDETDGQSISDETLVVEPVTVDDKAPDQKPQRTTAQSVSDETLVVETVTVDDKAPDQKPQRTTARVLTETTASMPGITTTLSAADKDVTLDIRWTVLCDLFLVLIADSVYDARSRVLLESVANKLGLGWLDVTRFECRVTEALEIQENVETLEHKELVTEHQKKQKKKRYMMLGLATLGGGLVIGLSAGLLAPVIGAGLGAAFTTIGITGTTGFLAGAGGAAVITTGGVLTGSGIAARGMAKRTQLVRTFNVLPLYNNKRVSCILTVPGFMNGKLDDVRLPFTVLDPVVGDVFSVVWEPEMIQETGSALKILTGEVLSQVSMTVLQATVMTALMSALQWPVILTKLGYLIDNPWNNALDRAKKAGLVLADVLIQRHLGVRPVTLIGFSLGSRVIFYALLELAKKKAFGVVQDVFLLGTTLSASTTTWCDARSIVSGRFVNCYARNDWVLNYLFRATSGGVGTVAGLRPVNNVPGMENIDVTDKIAGHMSYRTFMPLILDQLGFPVSADYFDEPEQPDFEGERIVVKEEETQKKKGWFFSGKKSKPDVQQVSRPPSAASNQRRDSTSSAPAKERSSEADEDLPPRLDQTAAASEGGATDSHPPSRAGTPKELDSKLPIHAGFDLNAIKQLVDSSKEEGANLKDGILTTQDIPNIPPHVPTQRTVSMPIPANSLDKQLKTNESVVENRLASLFDRSATVQANGRGNSRGGQSEDDFADFQAAEVSSEPQARPALHGSLPNRHKPSPARLSNAVNGKSEWESKTPSLSSFRSSSAVYLPSTSMTEISLDETDKPTLPSHSSTSLSDHSTPPGVSSLASTFSVASSSGLSFGGDDGSITIGSRGMASTSDPWSLSFAIENGPSLNKEKGKKRTPLSPGFDANPWS
ncbi:Protein of unknown function (DUF726) domain containing protein [Amanita muscaria]